MELFLKKITASEDGSAAGLDNKDRPAVIILHGLYGSGVNWHNIARLIANELRQDVYTLDLPNHGRSPWCDEFSYTSVARTVKEWFTDHYATFPGGVVLLGHSFGARISMITAARMDMVKGLVMADVSPFNDRKQDRIITLCHGMLMNRMVEALDAGVEDKDIDRYLTQHGVDLTNIGSLRQPYRRMNIRVVAESIGGMLADYAFINTNEDYSRLRGLPTLFIRGGADSLYIPQAAVDDLGSRFGNYTVATLSDTAHNLHHQKPEEFSAVFTAWYESNFR